MNKNRNNLIVVDVNSTLLDVHYAKYAIQSQERNIMPYFHGSVQQAIRCSDLNSLFRGFPVRFRSPKKGEDLKGKLCFNRVGYFGCEVLE